MFMSILSECVSVHQDVPDTQRGQKRASNPLELDAEGGEPPCGCWRSKSGPLEEKNSAQTHTETSLHSPL